MSNTALALPPQAPDSAPETAAVIYASRAQLVPSPLNPRKTFDPVKLFELGASIRGRNGIINPLIVRLIWEEPDPEIGKAMPVRYEIIAGERRWRAGDALPDPEHEGKTLFPVGQYPIIVRDLTDAECLELMLIENMQRRDLSPIEEMEAFARMLDFVQDSIRPYTVSSLAEKIGVSAHYVSQRLSLRKLTAAGRKALASGKIAFDTARTICKCPVSVVAQVEDEVLNPHKYGHWSGGEVMTAEETRDVIHRKFMRELRGAPFDPSREDLVPLHRGEDGEPAEGGSCLVCKWNTRNQPDEDGQRRKDQLCLNPACFNKKVEVNISSELVKAKEAGAKILSMAESAAVLNDNGSLPVSSPYVRLDEKLSPADLAGDVKKPPTWEKIVTGTASASVVVGRTPEGEAVKGKVSGAVDVPVTVAISKEGKVLHLVDRRVAIEAARKNGHENILNITKGRASSLQEEDARAQAQAKKELQKERLRQSSAILSALVAKIEDEGTGMPESLLRSLSAVAIRHAGQGGCLLFCKRRGIDKPEGPIVAAQKALRQCPATLELEGMVIELLVAQDWQGLHSSDSTGLFPEIAKGLLDYYGIDPKAVAASAKQADKAEKSDKAKGGKAKPAADESGPIRIQWSERTVKFEWNAKGDCVNPLEWHLRFPEECGDFKAVIFAAQLNDEWFSGEDVTDENAGMRLLPGEDSTAFESIERAALLSIEEIIEAVSEYSDPRYVAVEKRLKEYWALLDERISAGEETSPPRELTDAEIESFFPWCEHRKATATRESQFTIANISEELGIALDSATKLFDRFVDFTYGQKKPNEPEPPAKKPAKAKAKKGGASK